MFSDNNDGSQGPKVADPDKPLMDDNIQGISQPPRQTDEAGTGPNPEATPIPLSRPADAQFRTESQFSAPATSTAPSQPINSAMPETNMPNDPIHTQTFYPPPINPNQPMIPPMEVNTGGSVLEVQPAPDVNRRNFSPIKIIILAIIFVFFASIACLIAFGLGYLQNNYVPVISGFTEDLILSDGEQFSLRTKYLIDTGTYQLLTKHGKYFDSDIVPDKIKPIGADKIIEEIENIEDIRYKVSAEAKYDLQEPVLESVLGITDPGELNEDTINKIISSDEGTIKAYSENYLELKDDQNAENQIEIDFQVPDVHLNTLLQLKKVAEDLYVNINRFPENQYFKTEMIVGKWLKATTKEILSDGQTTQEVYSSLLPFSSIDEPTIDELLEGENKIKLSQEDYDKFLAILESDAFKNIISDSYDEKVANADAACYILTINRNNFINLLVEIGKNYPDSDMPDKEELEDEITDWPFSKFDIHICLAKMVTYPVKVKTELIWDYEGTKLEWAMDVELLATNQDTKVTPPEQYTNISDLDWDEITNSYGIEPTEVVTITEPNSYDFYTSQNICTYDYYPKGCMLCRTNSLDCALCLDIYNGNISNIDEEAANKCY